MWNQYRQFDGADALLRALQDTKSRNAAITSKDQLERNPLGFESGESFRDYLRHLLKCGEIRMCVTSFELTDRLQKNLHEARQVSLSRPPSTWLSLEHKETSLAAYLGFSPLGLGLLHVRACSHSRGRGLHDIITS